VHVSPELVQVHGSAAPTTKWQQSFDAQLTNVFQVQADIASRVAQALDVALGATARQQLAQPPTANLAAYDAFLRGEAVAQGMISNPLGVYRAVPYYERAVALDSTFAPAWAQLARSHSTMYSFVAPTPADSAASYRAAQRALALAPARPEGHVALGDYYAAVLRDDVQALAQYAEAHRLAPSNAEALTSVALAEVSLGRWDSAIEHLRQAERLDPRFALTAWQLGISLVTLRRYAEATQAFDHGLAFAPANLDIREGRAMVSLARGDLAGARAVLRAAPKEVDPSALVAYVGTYYDLIWMLDDAQEALLLRLTPSAFGGDRGQWGIVLAQTYALRGDMARARIYADSARAAFAHHLRAAPNDAQQRVFLGLALAYLGRDEEAKREGERAVALMPLGKDANTAPYLQHQLARIYILVNEPDKALDRLEPLLSIPYYLSQDWLKIDPNFDPLRSHPRFQRLVAGTN
jgi:tetratricopeptide (TPR) repeat protein